jgi:hypothetical protein
MAHAPISWGLYSVLLRKDVQVYHKIGPVNPTSEEFYVWNYRINQNIT